LIGILQWHSQTDIVMRRWTYLLQTQDLWLPLAQSLTYMSEAQSILLCQLLTE